MLELLLFYAIPREDTNVHAHLLLEKFGGLAGVFNASDKELCEVSGIGENAASLIKLIPQLSDILNNTEIKRLPLDSRQAILRYFDGIFDKETEQKMYIACLDDMLNLIRLSDIEYSTDMPESEVVRQLTQEIIRSNCTQCIIAINHVGRYATPTDKELRFITKIANYFAAINARLAEFVIHGNDGTRLILSAIELGII